MIRPDKPVSNKSMPIGALSIEILIPGCGSLKEKRGRLKPLLNRLHREFNISVAEMDHQDVWQNASIACALVSNDPVFIRRSLQKIVQWLESNWPDVEVIDSHIDLL